MSKHTDLIDAVNDSRTEYTHTFNQGVLSGWREAMLECGRRWDFREADEHTTARFGDVPMCCGVLLDWVPTGEKP